ncbi:hypothetical protein EBT31_07600 [bacterium]|nr:hypothetical protein [bacterium]
MDKGVPQVRSLWSGGERNVAVMAAQWSYLVERPGDALGAMTVRSDMAARLFRDKAFVFLNTGSKEANDALLAEAEAASQGTTVISASIPVDTSAATRSKLITTIIRPDIWYAAPPVCNVVFPEEYRAFSFRRPLLECTRLQLSTYDALIASGYEYEIQQRAYFAPVFGEGTGIDSLKEGGIGMASSPLVYPHEVYSGIVPKLERMSDIAFLAAMSAAVSEEEQTQYAEIAAAFNFLRNRYAGRTVSVSGRFLPRLVCGLPGAVVSRVPDSPLPELSPTHYVGMITSVTHSVSADAGATTSFTMAYARPHIPDESDQFVKSMRVLKSRKEASHTVSPLTGMSSLDESLASWLDGVLAAGDRVELTEAECASAPPGPNGKKIIRVVGIQVGATGTNTNETTSSETSPEQATSSPADPTSVHKFQSATFVEEFSGKDLPIEDAIRPPWISEDYNNTRIGPIFYKSLIGCASLTDLVSLQDAQEIDPKATAVSVELALTRVVGDYAMLSDGGAKVCSGWIWQQTKRAHGTIDDVLYGFHKNAYGDLSGLEGLGLDKPLSPKMAVSLDGDLAAGTVSATLDVRARRAEAVRRYANRLFGVRGLRG